jgi:hypothetical protein
MWLLPREARVEGVDVRVVTNRHRESDGGSQARPPTSSFALSKSYRWPERKVSVSILESQNLQRLTGRLPPTGRRSRRELGPLRVPAADA